MTMTDELSNWGVGLGIVTVALFPFAIPIIILTAVALLPLLVPVLAFAIVAAVVAAPIALVRRLRRRRGGPRPRKQSDPHEGGRSLRVGTVNADRAG